VIKSVGGQPVNSRYELHQALSFVGPVFMLEFTDVNGETKRVRVRRKIGAPLGKFPCPSLGDFPNVDFVMGSPLKNLLKRLLKNTVSALAGAVFFCLLLLYTFQDKIPM